MSQRARIRKKQQRIFNRVCKHAMAEIESNPEFIKFKYQVGYALQVSSGYMMKAFAPEEYLATGESNENRP